MFHARSVTPWRVIIRWHMCDRRSRARLSFRHTDGVDRRSRRAAMPERSDKKRRRRRRRRRTRRIDRGKEEREDLSGVFVSEGLRSDSADLVFVGVARDGCIP